MTITAPAKTILIVDDEQLMRRIVSDYLKARGYRLLEAQDGVEALRIFEQERPDLVLLDVMMPQMDGLTVCKTIRKTDNTPIILLTAKDSEEDELKGFDVGADEYIAKPFSLKILAARVEAVLRRHTSDQKQNTSRLRIDPLAREVYVDDRAIELTYTEFELLSFLITNQNIALSRDTILDNVWQYDYFGDSRTVDTHVKKLRSKLGEAGELIKTVRGIGYKYEVQP